jgi:lipopolysaccharide biosynthesis regulator YciM
VRAQILLGDVELAAGNAEAAAEAWRRIESQNPAFLALVTGKLRDVYRKLGREDEGVALLRGYLGKYGSLDLLNAVFEATVEREGAAAATVLVRDELKRNPTLLGLDKLLEAQILEAPVTRRHELELVKNLVQQHTRALAMYKCDHCGFRARQFYWRCPACGEWETYSPRRTEEKALPA